MEPYYTLYNTKLSLYFQTLIEDNPKKLKKLIKTLHEADKQAAVHEKDFDVRSDRIIVVFESEKIRNEILHIYGNYSMIQHIRYLVGM